MSSLVEEQVRVVREPRLVERVVFVGGHPGSGKTLLTAIVGGLDRVEMQKYNYALEHLCGLSFLGRLEEGVATPLIRMLADVDLYNMTMARDTNFRCSDYTSVFRNPGGWRYIRRLFQPGDAAAVERIRETHPILQITIHNILAISWPLFQALGDRVRILEVVRHPLYMIKQWRLYIERYGTDVRDFTIWFDYHGQALPFFALGWEEQYVRSNPMDRCIYSIERLSQLGRQVMERLSVSQRSQVMILPFEPFVLDPWPHLRQLEALLGTRVTARTRSELKRQRVPRRRIADGIPLKCYRQYGWPPPQQDADERGELESRRAYVAKEASAEGLRVMDELCRAYEAEHLHGAIAW